MSRGLGRYVAKRLGFAGLMLAGVSVMLFALMRLAPGGPEAVLVGGEFSQEVAAQVRQRLGLDRLGPTIQLTGGALGLALLVAVPVGTLAAVRRDTTRAPAPMPRSTPPGAPPIRANERSTTPSSRRSSWRTRRTSSSTTPSRSTSPARPTTGPSWSRPTVGSTSPSRP